MFSPFDAHKFLRSKWPERTDVNFANAVSAIRAALDTSMTVDAARLKFTQLH
ncbi:DUF982 domain-containing protein [Rhizobium sp. XQZ8]|uniref:DUF982 domain-containing protein n=1 Tax=Rhizobium populisoli TaxID=2859785 RepID=UPI001C66B180|nr:DUF982 domain-containing protein [Rhizobium populisoli]